MAPSPYISAMFARLILALLLALSLTPVAATAACHTGMASHHAKPSHAPDTAVPAHLCIGCVAPADRLGAPAAPRAIGGGVPFRADAVVAVRSAARMPPLPPPQDA